MLRRSNRNKQRKDGARQQKAADSKAAVHKHGLSTVDDITFAHVERLTGNELDAMHKFKIGKAAKGNVAEKRAAVAAVLGMHQAVQQPAHAPDSQ